MTAALIRTTVDRARRSPQRRRSPKHHRAPSAGMCGDRGHERVRQVQVGDGLPAGRPLATVGGVTSTIVIGVVTRTGSAVAVTLSGPAATPRFRARREIGLVPPGLAAQPYHTAAGMDLAAAGQMIGQVESAAEQAAAAGLRALAGTLLASAIRGVAVVVKAVSVPDHLADILLSHAWMHSAEGMLYRQAVLAAAAKCMDGPRGRTVRTAGRGARPHGARPGRRTPLAPDRKRRRTRRHHHADSDSRLRVTRIAAEPDVRRLRRTAVGGIRSGGEPGAIMRPSAVSRVRCLCVLTGLGGCP